MSMKEVIIEVDERAAEGFRKIIRCKDCKNFNDSKCWCESWQGVTFGSGFCSYGIRKRKPEEILKSMDEFCKDINKKEEEEKVTDGTFTFSSPESEEEFNARAIISITSLSKLGKLFVDLRDCEDLYDEVKRIRLSVNCGKKITFEKVIPCDKCQFYDSYDMECLRWNCQKDPDEFCSDAQGRW